MLLLILEQIVVNDIDVDLEQIVVKDIHVDCYCGFLELIVVKDIDADFEADCCQGY